MVTFNGFVLFGLLVRFLFVAAGIILSFRIIGFKNIDFIKSYIRTHAFPPYRLFYWFVAFASIIYFEHLVSEANSITFSEAYAKNWFLSLLVTFLLFSVTAYASIEAQNSIRVAKEIKSKLEWAQRGKIALAIANIVSFFIPVAWLARIGLVAIVSGLAAWLDSHIENEVAKKIIENIGIMLIIALINLLIILISTYIITDKIIFW